MNADVVVSQPLVPGIGVAGQVFCPYLRSLCMKQGCELWVELKTGGIFVARCAISWGPILACETNQSLRSLVLTPSESGTVSAEKTEDV